MIRYIMTGAVLVVGSIFSFYLGGPTKGNDTIAEVEAYLKREEALKARQRANAELAEREADESRQADEKEKEQLLEQIKELERREQQLRIEIDTANQLVEQERAARN